MHCNFRPPDIGPVVLDWTVLAKMCTAHAEKLLFLASGQNYYIAIKLSDLDFLKECNNLAIRRHFQVLFLTVHIKICHIFISGIFDLMTSNMCHMLRCALELLPMIKFEVGQPDLQRFYC